MTPERFEHRWVDVLPDVLEEGILYVSIKYTTAAHLCADGCGREVVTPLRPSDWHITFDGETVSLSPSIGNWSFPCQSHYFIKKNEVCWARRWTAGEIADGRAHDAARTSDPSPSDAALAESPARPWWRRLRFRRR